MSKASFNIFDELSAWGRALPAWQRCLLAKLVGAVEFSDAAVDEVFAEYLIDQGLLASTGLRQAWDIALPQFQSHAPPIAARMTAMTGVLGVNALAAGETLTFGPTLTVVYGPNATGKSGYARVLKAACFTRSKETEILGDVRLDKHKQPKPRATFTFDDGASTTFAYQEPCPRMRDNFAVFDSSCVRVHLDERNAFQVMPYLFDVFPRMVEAFGRVQSKLRVAIVCRSPTVGKFAISDSRSQVANLLENLTAQTDLNALKALAVFGENESVRLDDVRRQLTELRTTDPKEIINRNEQRIRDLDSVKASLAALVAVITPKLVRDIEGVIGQVRQLADKSAALSAAQFGQEPVQPVGTAAWRELLSAAVAYNAEAYPGDVFPAKAAGARCVLCHQPLDEDSSDRLARFYQVVTSDVEAQLKRARMTLQAYRERISKLNVAFFVEESAVRRTLREVDATLESDVARHVDSFRSIIDLLIHAAETVTEPAAADLVDGTFSHRISSIAERLQQKNENLRLKDPKTLIESLSAEEQLLIDRKRLSGQYEEIATAVADLQWVAKANACIRSFATTQRDVTTKQKALAKELVAQGFIARFADNCASFQLNLPVQFRFAGDAGTTDRQIEIASASGVDPSDVLSEGEQTAAALADFLTEIELNGSCAGVVFDDPVTSMDHIRKESIARRLVDEATRRQVIVFTHDILFTNYLATAVGEKGVQFAGRTVCRGEKDEPGAIDRLAFPQDTTTVQPTIGRKSILAQPGRSLAMSSAMPLRRPAAACAQHTKTSYRKSCSTTSSGAGGKTSRSRLIRSSSTKASPRVCRSAWKSCRVTSTRIPIRRISTRFRLRSTSSRANWLSSSVSRPTTARLGRRGRRPSRRRKQSSVDRCTELHVVGYTMSWPAHPSTREWVEILLLWKPDSALITPDTIGPHKSIEM